MIRILFFYFLFLVSGSIYSQADKAINSQDSLKNEIGKTVDNDTTLYSFVEKMPAYPGGENEMFKFIVKSIIYPPNCENFSGKVVVRFVINQDGSISDINVIKSLSPRFDKEIIRVMELLQPFTPGMQNGKAVRVYYILPIFFN